jgi:hypothetical protein
MTQKLIKIDGRLLTPKQAQAVKRRLYMKNLYCHMSFIEHHIRNQTNMKDLKKIKTTFDKIVRWDELYKTI